MPQVIKSLVGVWEFIDSTMKDINGRELQDPFSNASGNIIYTDTNYMSVQLSIPKDNAIDEKLKYEEGYLAYYGTYSFNESEQIVTHRAMNSNRSELPGKLLKRKVKYHADRNCISLQNVEPEQVGMELPIYRQLFWRKLNPAND